MEPLVSCRTACAVDLRRQLIFPLTRSGCVLADRLSADPNITVAVIEGGPSDHDLPQVLQLSEWLTLLGGPYDYQYPTTEQPRGNSHILHSRAKVLGTSWHESFDSAQC